MLRICSGSTLVFETQWHSTRLPDSRYPSIALFFIENNMHHNNPDKSFQIRMLIWRFVISFCIEFNTIALLNYYKYKKRITCWKYKWHDLNIPFSVITMIFSCISQSIKKQLPNFIIKDFMVITERLEAALNGTRMQFHYQKTEGFEYIKWARKNIRSC